MAQLTPQPATGTKKNRTPRSSLRIDMTPMVDLGFLLITFFIFTTSMAESKGTDLFLPEDGSPVSLANSAALTILLTGGDRIILYPGDWKEALSKGEIFTTNYAEGSGLGKYIRAKQKALGFKKDDLMLLIKPDSASTYSNLINALDEVLINNVKRYALVAITKEEQNFVHYRNIKTE